MNNAFFNFEMLSVKFADSVGIDLPSRSAPVLN